MTTHVFNKNSQTAETGLNQPSCGCANQVGELGADDAFSCWLHDDKPVKIDWSAFGIERLHSESSS